MAGTRYAIAAAVNDQAVLGHCLSQSPDIVSGNVRLRTYEGYRTAGIAYNQALDECDADILILAHQDVYLPKGFMAKLDTALRELDAKAPDWAVAGIVGLDAAGQVHGRVWSTGLDMLIAGSGALPARVETLDELIIIVRTDAGLRFDEKLPSFHLYAADIIQIAASAGRSTWAVDAPAIHHDKPVINLGGGYRQAWLYMRRKWRSRLPLVNLVCPITEARSTLWIKDLRVRVRHRWRRDRPDVKGNPAHIAERLGFDS